MTHLSCQKSIGQLVCTLIISAMITMFGTHTAAEDAHEHPAGNTDDHAGESQSPRDQEANSEHSRGLVQLSADQVKMAGIEVDQVRIQPLTRQLYAPGEVINNQYSTTQIAPKITSQVIKRRVVLGQDVVAGKPLVTLYSVELASVQADLLVAHKEWQRVEKLGQKAVGAKRFTEAKVEYDQLLSQVGAYGLTTKETNNFLSNQQGDYRLGEFSLLAPHPGVVLRDDFSEGQSIEAGRTLITLVDESTVWVEASLAPDIGIKLSANDPAIVEVQGMVFQGHVTQQAHLFDEATRTWKVRVLIDNPGHILHAGLFAEVLFTLSTQQEGIVVPDSALMRSTDGDWAVFVEQAPGQFKQTEVGLAGSSAGHKVIEGIPANTRIAIAGAFFIASEMAKSGFDPHDH